MEKQDMMELSYPELEQLFVSMGEKKFRAKQVYEWIHKKLAVDFDEITNISAALRRELSRDWYLGGLICLDKRVSADGCTAKYLFGLDYGEHTLIESVLMKYYHGNSVCISSQAGCRMGCRFCASTLNGLERNLRASEMLGQIYHIQKESHERVSNIVVMGTGEPLDNYEELLRFINMVTNDQGLHISQRNITVSTCGLVEKIRALAKERLQITLAISLHAPNDAVRKQMMPIAERYSIREILDACDDYYKQTGRRISYEYCLAAGVNDLPEHARELAALLKGKNCHVNLIPVNAVKEREFISGNRNDIKKFKLILEKAHINVTIRREMGADIHAACGQLRKRYKEEKHEILCKDRCWAQKDNEPG